MPNKTKSYLTSLLLILLVAGLAFQSHAQTIFLEPDSIFIHDGVGTEFDLELRADAAVLDLKLFLAEFNYDSNRLDTVLALDTLVVEPLEVDTSVMIYEGDFWDATGGGTFFGWRFRNNDSTLRLENLVLGSGVAADGPGQLATMRFAAKDTGRVDLYFKDHLLKNVAGDEIASAAEGAVVFIDYPPLHFDLLEPPLGDIIFGEPGETIVLTWAKSNSVYPGEDVTYNLDISRSPIFDPGETDNYIGLTDTTFVLYQNDLSAGAYYWRVSAVGDLYGYERLSNPESSWFGFDRYPPDPFSLVSPIEGVLVEKLPNESIEFVWHKSESPYPEESVYYTFVLSRGAGALISVSGLTDTTYEVAVAGLEPNTYYWSVVALGDTYALQQQSDPSVATFEFDFLATPPEPFDLTHPFDVAVVNVYGLDDLVFEWEEAVNDGFDVTYDLYLGPEPTFPGSEVLLVEGIDALQVSVEKSLLPLGEWQYWRVNAVNNFDLNTWSTSTFSVLMILKGDIDNNGQVDVADLVYFVKYMFHEGPPPPLEEVCDIDCSGQVDVADLVFLVKYMFHEGPPPFCNYPY